VMGRDDEDDCHHDGHERGQENPGPWVAEVERVPDPEAFFDEQRRIVAVDSAAGVMIEERQLLDLGQRAEDAHDAQIDSLLGECATKE